MVAECWHALGAAHVPPRRRSIQNDKKKGAPLFAAAPHVLLEILSKEKAGRQFQLLLHVFILHA